MEQINQPEIEYINGIKVIWNSPKQETLELIGKRLGEILVKNYLKGESND